MRVLLVDDDQLVSLSLKTILEAQADIEVVGTGNSGEAAVTLFQELQPDVLLMDIRMGELSGLEAAEQILEQSPTATIVFLTTFLDNDYVIRSLKIGAKGYILKQNFDSIVPSMRAVCSGQSVFGDQIVSLMPDLLNAKPVTGTLAEDLTEREFAILTEIAEGLNNKEIAEQLFLSEGTVRNYISVLLDKLGLRDRTQLAIYFYKNQG